MKIAIIGGGPSALMAADVLAGTCTVDLYERGRTIGRKFLVAGDGGLNITNSVEGDELLSHYTHPEFMRPMLYAFGPNELRLGLAKLVCEHSWVAVVAYFQRGRSNRHMC
ncbi:MAG: NAD(P)/FAD-dependent oxidoreductase [Flavobacteriales bacterium]|nr:NAD(P)/FAD-dependent oxidoreductase [Flavobacteriales bacterium]